MPSTPSHHIRSLPIHVPPLWVSLQCTELVVSVPDIELSNRQHQHDLDFGQCHFLPNTVARPTLKRAPCVFWRVQRVAFRHKPTLREKFLRLRPVARVVMCAVMIAPYHTMIRRKGLAVVTRQVKIRLAVTEGGYSGVHAKSFFDNSEGVGQLIEELRLRREDGSGVGGVRAEDGVVLGADFGENVRMLGEEMIGEDGTRRSGIVTCEDEELDLGHGKVFERGVDACSRRVLGQVGFQRKIDDGLIFIVCFAMNDAVTAVEFPGKVAIHSIFIVRVDKWPKDVDIFQRVDVHPGGTPFELLP